LLLRNGHPALKLVVPRFSGWDVYADIFLPGGLQAKALLRDWARLTSAFDSGRLTDVFGWTGGLIARGLGRGFMRASSMPAPTPTAVMTTTTRES
jgi:predicted acyl esterase